MIYAQITGGQVTNIVVAADVSVLPSPATQWVRISVTDGFSGAPHPGIGWSFDGTNFKSPDGQMTLPPV